MLFTKDPDMSYTDMCIFFDNNFYSEDRDNELCFKYMYLVYYMLAFKKHYLQNYNEYDEFAEYATITIYTRYLKKWENGERIKSLLNYAKATLYPLKVAFQKEYYKEIIDSNKLNIDTSILHETLRENIQQQYNYNIEEDTLDNFKNLPILIWNTIKKSPYKKDPVISRRLYLSIYLTLLNEITLPTKKLENLHNKIDEGYQTDSLNIAKLLKKERFKEIIIWRLPLSMTDYIKVLINIVKVDLQNELKRTRDYYRLPDDVLDAILNTAWEQSLVRVSDSNEEI